MLTHFLWTHTGGSLIICSKADDKLFVVVVVNDAIRDTYTCDKILKNKTMVNTKFSIVAAPEESGRNMGSSINTPITLMQDFSPLRLLVFEQDTSFLWGLFSV